MSNLKMIEQSTRRLAAGSTVLDGDNQQWTTSLVPKARRLASRLGLPLILISSALPAAETFPLVRAVEKQPLLAQVSRLQEALEFIGQPLKAAVREQLAAAAHQDSAAGVAAAIQSALDPLCLGAVSVQTDGSLEFTPAAITPRLIEQGWRAVLVKVSNAPGLKDALRMDSPGARPLPESPPAAVPQRWIDVEMYDRRPLNPTLSGLALEYRIVQLWAREPGNHPAQLSFKLSHTGANPARVDEVATRIWNFDADAEGWQAENQCELSVRNGVLRIASSGGDPFLGTTVRMPPGEKVVRVRAKVGAEAMWQLFWTTEKRRSPDPGHVVSFQATRSAGDWTEFKFNFTAEDHLVGVRLDPGNAPGKSEIDSIAITDVQAAGPDWASTNLTFTVEPAIPVAVRIRDLPGLPALAAFIIRDVCGQIYPLQSKRLEPDFFFQPQIYRGDGEHVPLPAGKYTITCSRGPESVPEDQTVTISEQQREIAYTVKRWVNPMARGWYSGDHHIHGAGCLHYTKPTEGVTPRSMIRHTMGEDLKVGCSLNWGPGFDYQKDFFCGTVDPVSRYPYLLRQDVEVSGFGSQESGHLCLLRLKQQIPPGGDSKEHWWKLCLNTLRWAKAQGAVTGTVHSSLGLEGSVGRVLGPDGPNGLPSYDIPRYDGIGANEFVVDVTHQVPGPDGKLIPAIDFIATMNSDRRLELNMWYHVLNTGLRPRASGETDFPCMSGARVGIGRVYVKLDGKLNFDDWCDKLRDGRSYISDGTSHLMEFAATDTANRKNKVAVGERGSELHIKRPGKVKLTVIAATRQLDTNAVPLEVVVNGYPVASKMIKSAGREQEVTFEVPIDSSSWVAVRTFPSAHTNPIFVIVDGTPIRASRRSAEWCLRGVDQCWSQKERFYLGAEHEQARLAYDHARQTYQQILNKGLTD
jgi:hypothetical protein